MKLKSLMVRYIVNDADASVAFYTRNLGFAVGLFEPAPDAAA